ncbi:MAG: HupE/UreJ family protein [Pseudomonadota bacterium]
MIGPLDQPQVPRDRRGVRGRPRLICALALILTLAAAASLSVAPAATAHEIRPAYLELTERRPGVFDVVWRQPVRNGKRLKLAPRFPEGCAVGRPQAERAAGTVILRHSLRCNLRQGEIGIDGMDRTMTDALLRLRRLGAPEITAVLRPGAARFALAQAQRGAAAQGVGAFLGIGVEHILFGPDHLLFVIGLALLARGRRLLWAVTAFTLAHSITLALSALGGASLPGPPVEIVIALSLAMLAGEAVRHHRAQAQQAGAAPPTRFPLWAAAFGFGLVHGLGFAGALQDIGLPAGAEAWALLWFNLGVELGQLAALAALLAVFWALRRLQQSALTPVRITLAYAVGVAGAFWTLERTAAAFLL